MAQARILVGTAGWSYPDWRGTFYPSSTRGRGEFDTYRRTFETVEVNTTFYRIPSPRMASGWVQRLGDETSFLFTVKAWQGFSHDESAAWSSKDARAFIDAVTPLQERDLLGAVLLQFPWSFRASTPSRDRLSRLADDLQGLPLVAEVRHASWDHPDTLSLLKRLRMGVCNVDQPSGRSSLPPSALATSPIGYVRLHGRNASAWFSREAGRDQRYDYLYSEPEIQGWLPRIQAIASQPLTKVVFVIANNHFRGQAPANALQIRSLLEGRRLPAPASLIKTWPFLKQHADAMEPVPAKPDDLAAHRNHSPGPLFDSIYEPPPEKLAALAGDDEIPRPRVLRTAEDDDHSDAPTPERRYLVEVPHAGMRLDTFLCLAMPWRSRAANQNLVGEGRATIVRAGHALRPRKAGRLIEDDVVHVRFPPLEQTIRHAEIAASLNVLYEDEALIVVDKPPGLVAHPVGRTRVNTLLNALHYRFRRPEDQGSSMSGPILGHRLDRDTSGVCLVARDRDVRRRLQETFEARKVRKQYLALVHGTVTKDLLEIRHPLGTHPLGVPKTLMAVVPEGMQATTHVEVIERFGSFSLVRAHPHEGRQHQIRVHLAAAGHPIVADSLYGPGGPGFAPPSPTTAIAEVKPPPPLTRQALHAEKICLPHPLTGKPLEIEAPWPQDMARCLEQLRSRSATLTGGMDS